jgi:hypothetical protein
MTTPGQFQATINTFDYNCDFAVRIGFAEQFGIRGGIKFLPDTLTQRSPV